MRITQKIRCPNCGSHGDRYYFTNNQITQTSCPACDYLMVNCSRTGKVVEAYAPGIALRCS
ncbi:MAG: replication restart DNA helicase PriA [Xenococcaceae cyanobacterium]